MTFNRYHMHQLLLSRGAHVTNQIFQDSRYDPIYCGTELHKVFDLLIKSGGDPSHKDIRGYTPVHNAIACDKAGTFRAFHELGVRLDALDPVGRNILHLVAMSGTYHLIKAMRNAQVTINPQALDNHGLKPLDYFRRRIGLLDEERHPAEVKPSKSDIAEFRVLLREVGERYNQGMGRRTIDEKAGSIHLS